MNLNPNIHARIPQQGPTHVHTDPPCSDEWKISDQRRNARIRNRNDTSVRNAIGAHHIARDAQNCRISDTYARVCGFLCILPPDRTCLYEQMCMYRRVKTKLFTIRNSLVIIITNIVLMFSLILYIYVLILVDDKSVFKRYTQTTNCW